MTFAVGTIALLAACSDDSSSDPLTAPKNTGTPTVEALAECTAPAFLKEGDKKTIDTDKLTEKTSLSKALLKMLAGKIFKIEE